MAASDKSQEPEISPAEKRVELVGQILASDLAVEIQAEFNGRLAVGLDVAAATGHVIGKFHSALTSAQDGPVFLIALAALQLREGHLQAVIRDAALDLIETGEAIAAYRPDDFSQRKAVAVMLEEFGEMLSNETVQD